MHNNTNIIQNIFFISLNTVHTKSHIQKVTKMKRIGLDSCSEWYKIRYIRCWISVSRKSNSPGTWLLAFM